MDNFFMYKKAVRAMDEINRVMEGKGHTVHQIMTAILAGGHILIEDIPGVGKTTLALAFSKVLGLDYQRIQFTPDIMPSVQDVSVSCLFSLKQPVGDERINDRKMK